MSGGIKTCKRAVVLIGGFTIQWPLCKEIFHALPDFSAQWKQVDDARAAHLSNTKENVKVLLK